MPAVWLFVLKEGGGGGKGIEMQALCQNLQSKQTELHQPSIVFSPFPSTSTYHNTRQFSLLYKHKKVKSTEQEQEFSFLQLMYALSCKHIIDVFNIKTSAHYWNNKLQNLNTCF